MGRRGMGGRVSTEKRKSLEKFYKSKRKREREGEEKERRWGRKSKATLATRAVLPLLPVFLHV